MFIYIRSGKYICIYIYIYIVHIHTSGCGIHHVVLHVTRLMNDVVELVGSSMKGFLTLSADVS